MKHLFEEYNKTDKKKLDNNYVSDNFGNKYFSIEDWQRDFPTTTGEQKAISEYASISLLQVINLPYSKYMILRRDSWVRNMSSSEEGKELLKSLGIEGEYEGIGHCVLGYPLEEEPQAAERKKDYIYYIR